ncbi:hypothetical protein [Pseudomonas sp. PSKL.D1]|uniref:hypothetical protein n=1 Tax=Pseudomonas sp. PSKL.D1 TaxID=3029060 RepID=UPI002380D28A|nr:hypothetical protein [Pseudomonas sp. PSKL.D1]WDY60349.1 hypothetical protein PVV54_12205 [Pseudomonas sp. PSKL.D1]
MTEQDQELLRLAAKAAGFEVRWTDEDVFQGSFLRKVIPEPQSPASKWLYWRPLIDDGDAFSLAMSLNMMVNFTAGGAIAYYNKGLASGSISDPSPHRAIVRAAAAIGSLMP